MKKKERVGDVRNENFYLSFGKTIPLPLFPFLSSSGRVTEHGFSGMDLSYFPAKTKMVQCIFFSFRTKSPTNGRRVLYFEPI